MNKKEIKQKSQPKKTWIGLLLLFLFIVGVAGVITLQLNGFFSPTANEAKPSEKPNDKKVESAEVKKQTSSKENKGKTDKQAVQQSSGKQKEQESKQKEAKPLLDPEKPVSESIEMKEVPERIGPTAPAKPEAPTAPKKIEFKLETSQTEK
ncbi:hypothetical protein [Aneurinibacillus uraniidurans]|uniref:hypothetical protein n=1 Tax=Aneurinibacillus uraniidurans TaxID=2966586 RepID=UPI00234B1DCB|nr:hypothetical protein [Aneurinibacillus sp. B1]WCN37149.1 hypothetical protein PO771_15050 [Aneurinibacillus sp. B1]